MRTARQTEQFCCGFRRGQFIFSTKAIGRAKVARLFARARGALQRNHRRFALVPLLTPATAHAGFSNPKLGGDLRIVFPLTPFAALNRRRGRAFYTSRSRWSRS